VAQRGLGLARVVVAVVAEEDDLPAELRLEAPGGEDLGGEEAPREEPAGLLAEADEGAQSCRRGRSAARRADRSLEDAR
jgi:hypothetical protein